MESAAVTTEGRKRESRQIAGQTLLLGDCLEIMQGMAPGSFDVVVTSPPYNLGIGYATHYDRMAQEDYLAWMDRAAEGMARVLDDRGSVFLNMGSSLKSPLVPYQVLEVFLNYFTLQNNIVWAKSLWVERAEKTFGHFKPINSPRYLNHNFEHVFHLTKEGDVPVERLAIGVPFEYESNIARFSHERNLRCRGNVWHLPYKTVQSRKTARGSHPATFPAALPEMCLRLAGREKTHGPARVLDPFAGTGSTLVAARDLGLAGTGIDIDESYLEFARQRLEEAPRQGLGTP